MPDGSQPDQPDKPTYEELEVMVAQLRHSNLILQVQCNEARLQLMDITSINIGITYPQVKAELEALRKLLAP